MISFRSFEIMQYFSYYDSNDINVIIDRLEQLTQLKQYALIVHDKDKNDDGSFKDKHFHIVVTLKNQMTDIQISNIMKIETQYINKIKTTTRKAFEYLIHKNDLNKFQYDIDSVVSNFDYKEFIEKETKKDNEIKILDNLLEKIENGDIKEYNITDYFNQSMYIKYNKQIKLSFEYRNKKIKEVDRDMNCIFVYGDSGSGKTTYAKELSKVYGTPYISSSGKHMLDDYGGQKLIILDDIRSTDISVSELLKLLDNNTSSLVNCRYYNKSIYECKMIVLTSTIGPVKFFSECKDNNAEDVKQLLRRLNYIVRMDKDKIHISKYDISKELEFEIQTLPNTITKFYELQEKKQENLLGDLKNIATNFGL